MVFDLGLDGKWAGAADEVAAGEALFHIKTIGDVFFKIGAEFLEFEQGVRR